MSDRAAETKKKRAYRRRLRCGETVLPVPVNLARVAEAALRAGALTEAEALDRAKLAAVAAEVVDDWARFVGRRG